MKQLTLRLPDDLHALLKTLAETEDRSMHAEVLQAIKEHLERRGLRVATARPPS